MHTRPSSRRCFGLCVTHAVEVVTQIGGGVGQWFDVAVIYAPSMTGKLGMVVLGTHSRQRSTHPTINYSSETAIWAVMLLNSKISTPDKGQAEEGWTVRRTLCVHIILEREIQIGPDTRGAAFFTRLKGS